LQDASEVESRFFPNSSFPYVEYELHNWAEGFIEIGKGFADQVKYRLQ
jgi:hypothetical protein